MDQQKQTLAYFESAADGWQAKAVSPEDEYNLITARNDAVLSVVAEMPNARCLLDVGCGTGQLVLAAAAKGLDAEGIDFSAPMVAHCEENRSGNESRASFRCASFFEITWPAEHFDVISAQGLIEYLSLEQLEEFFARCQRLLKPGGALIIGSRNRLFNIVSMNAFSKLEHDLGVLPLLEAEAIALLSGATQQEAFTALRRFERVDPQPDQHPDTGISVDVRYQFSPADLICRLRRYGFEPQTLFPIHFHALPASLRNQYPAIHHQLAKLLGTIAQRAHQLVPFSSSFVLDVRKT